MYVTSLQVTPCYPESGPIYAPYDPSAHHMYSGDLIILYYRFESK